MNERNKLIEEMVNDLLEKSEEEYQKCKLILLSQTNNSVKLRSFVYKLFAYTDAKRPLLIELKKEMSLHVG